MAIVAKMCR